MVTKKALVRVQRDKAQTVMNLSSKTVVEQRKEVVRTVYEFTDVTYLCPFCLHEGHIAQFEFKTPKGKISKMAKCPECHNKMRKQTLTEPMTPRQYASFIFFYALSGFWKKVNFRQFNERLRALGISYEFWQEYKKLKGKGYVAEQEERYEQEQEKWHKEQEHQEETIWKPKEDRGDLIDV